MAEDTNKQEQQQPAQQQPSNQQSPAVEIDYDKIASLIQGKQTVTEDTVLKSYFKQQGLSPEEMTQAIAQFKQVKATQEPDVGALQTQLTQAQQEAAQARLESAATVQALSMGVDVKTVPYLLKIADLSGAAGEDGTVSTEALTNAINKVLEDVPALKPEKQENKGFQIGAGNSGQETQTDNNVLANIFGNKKG